MDKPTIRNFKDSPERRIQDAIIEMLTIRGWYVMETHGNMFQRGFPDLYATHSQFGGRWIEVKNPEQYSFTAAQLECFPKMTAFGTGIWILVAATECEYNKLFKPANWWVYNTNFKGIGGR